MQVVLPIDDFLFELFPAYRDSSDVEALKQEVSRYYTYGSYQPSVSLQDGLIIIDIDSLLITAKSEAFRNIVSLCEKGKYEQAKKVLMPLLQKNPTNSEYHRIYGQILSDEGDQEEAINVLIDALRWDSKNLHALLM